MGKVVLIMDMPKNCYECKLQVRNMVGDYICVINHKNADNCASRGTWCPLKEVPEKIDEKPVSEYEFGSLGKGYEVGWNACLKAILNGGINKDEPIHNRYE